MLGGTTKVVPLQPRALYTYYENGLVPRNTKTGPAGGPVFASILAYANGLRYWPMLLAGGGICIPVIIGQPRPGKVGVSKSMLMT